MKHLSQDMKKLSDYSYNVYSQFGEDGIIETLFSVIGTISKICIEFGAWDGFRFSNTANLWTKGWKGILIEANKAKYKELLRNTAGYDCHCIAAVVSYAGENTLENIFRMWNLPREIDFLSIDIDGDDYFVFESLREIRPRVIACEYNPTIPPHMELVAEPGNYFGCSPLSLVKLAETKGYRLIALTDTNCFFVLEADFDKFHGYETSLGSLAITKYLTYLLSGYSGDYLASREPIYGCSHRSTQRFFRGNGFRIPRENNINPLVRRLLRLIRRTQNS